MVSTWGNFSVPLHTEKSLCSKLEVDGSGGSCIRLGGKSASGDVNEVAFSNRWVYLKTASSHSLEHPAQSAGSMVIRSGVAMLFVAGEKGREQAKKQRGSRENCRWGPIDTGIHTGCWPEC